MQTQTEMKVEQQNKKPTKMTTSKYTLVKQVRDINPHIKYLTARSKGELEELLKVLIQEEEDIKAQMKAKTYGISFSRREY